MSSVYGDLDVLPNLGKYYQTKYNSMDIVAVPSGAAMKIWNCEWASAACEKLCPMFQTNDCCGMPDSGRAHKNSELYCMSSSRYGNIIWVKIEDFVAARLEGKIHAGNL